MYSKISRRNVTQEQYFAEVPGYSSTDIRAFVKAGMNPLAVREAEPINVTPAMTLGSAFDCALLEPELFGARYAVLPEGASMPTTDLQHAFVAAVRDGQSALDAFNTAGYKNGTQAKAAALLAELEDFIACQSTGLVALTPDQKKTIESMLEAVRAHSKHALLMSGDPQAVFVGEYKVDRGEAITVKGMLDILHGEDMVTDVKTTADWEGIRGNFFRRGYDVQLAHYGQLSGAFIQQIFYVESRAPWRTKLVDVTAYCNEAIPVLNDAVYRLQYAHANGAWTHAMEYYTTGYEAL